ncbi:MAG: hypothetical protein ABI624_13695 [Casimicrobiaceae bacterium]
MTLPSISGDNLPVSPLTRVRPVFVPEMRLPTTLTAPAATICAPPRLSRTL